MLTPKQRAELRSKDTKLSKCQIRSLKKRNAKIREQERQANVSTQLDVVEIRQLICKHLPFTDQLHLWTCKSSWNNDFTSLKIQATNFTQYYYYLKHAVLCWSTGIKAGGIINSLTGEQYQPYSDTYQKLLGNDYRLILKIRERNKLYSH